MHPHHPRPTLPVVLHSLALAVLFRPGGTPGPHTGPRGSSPPAPRPPGYDLRPPGRSTPRSLARSPRRPHHRHHRPRTGQRSHSGLGARSLIEQAFAQALTGSGLRSHLRRWQLHVEKGTASAAETRDRCPAQGGGVTVVTVRAGAMTAAGGGLRRRRSATATKTGYAHHRSPAIRFRDWARRN